MHTIYGQVGQPANVLHSAALCGAIAALANIGLALGWRPWVLAGVLPAVVRGARQLVLGCDARDWAPLADLG